MYLLYWIYFKFIICSVYLILHYYFSTLIEPLIYIYIFFIICICVVNVTVPFCVCDCVECELWG